MRNSVLAASLRTRLSLQRRFAQAASLADQIERQG